MLYFPLMEGIMSEITLIVLVVLVGTGIAGAWAIGKAYSFRELADEQDRERDQDANPDAND